MIRICLIVLVVFFIFVLALIHEENKTFDFEIASNSPYKNKLLKRDYTAFTCWLSCKERATVMCHYRGYFDTGNASRPSKFTFDPDVDKNCQQKSTKSYSNGYDRFVFYLITILIFGILNQVY